MYKRKLMVLIMVLLVVNIILVGCAVVEKEQINTSENKKENINSGNYKLTIEDIKKNYTEEKILNIEQINDEYVLVESQRETCANKFELYNLRTGDKDIMPTMPEFVTLEKIENENHIVFLSSGRNSECCFGTFPYLIRCIRVKSDIESTDDFIALHEDKYFKLSEPVSSGSKGCSVLSDIIVTLDSIQVLFEPIPGQEAQFYAAATDIPVTSIYYDEDKNQMIIEMKIAHIGNIFKEKKEILTEKNKYIGSIQIVQSEEDVKLIIDIEDIAREYIAKIKRIPKGLPFFEISFRS